MFEVFNISSVHLPVYRQLSDTCGLSTFLMLLNPEDNEAIKSYLNQLYGKLEFLVIRSPRVINSLDEYKWSVVLDYLLLKTLGENPISSYLYERIPDLIDVYKVESTSRLQNKTDRQLRRLPQSFSDFYISFFENNLVNPYILESSLYSLRTDLELKILFSLFGGKFLYQQLDSEGGSGAVYFTKKEFQTDSESWKRKVSVLENHLKKESSTSLSRIALNLGSHWVSVKSVSETEGVVYNDSIPGKSKNLKIKRLTESNLFYLFNYKPTLAFFTNKINKDFLSGEIEKEFNNLSEFTKNIVKKIEKSEDIVVKGEEQKGFRESTRESIKEGVSEIKPIQNLVDTNKQTLDKEDTMDRVKKIIRSKFSDYNKI